MSRRFLSPAVAAAVLLAGAPALAEEVAHAAAPTPAVAVVAAKPAASDTLEKKVQELEARLRQTEEKVAEAQRRAATRIAPPDAHAESW